MSTYVYSNRVPQAVNHHAYLALMLDEFTIGRIGQLVPSLYGLSCLEVGAGGGSIATWLAAQVGQDGRVVATDLNPMPVRPVAGLTVLQHDITTQPIPDPPYDLIHARLVLMHLPQRLEVLRSLATALAPGGVLLVEDMDMTWQPGRAMRAPSAADADLFDYYYQCLTAVFANHGVDPGWACKAVEAMDEIGLAGAAAEIHARSWRGGSAGCLFLAGGAAQLRDQLLAEGMTEDDLDRMRDLMLDPRMVVRMSPLVSTAGWRR
ncbi:MAG: class I SAM-dependent methyltransferase [Micromonosporaceae bacterium]|nr:class I SAM-dependent methyltransferase [Micromonosporaceae bacterium]